MLSRPAVSLPFRHVITDSTMFTATIAKPTMRGPSVPLWMPNGEIPARSSRPRSAHMRHTSSECRPSAVQ